jgi:hypothetical protein
LHLEFSLKAQDGTVQFYFILNFQSHQKVGIVERGQIGFLLWDKDDATSATFNIGSRLKTPILPLWVTKCNDVIGVLFNPNKELLKTHDAEKK